MKCGREPGGLKADELGICSAAIETSTDSINGGENGGRACWALSGTFCEEKCKGLLQKKLAIANDVIFTNWLKGSRTLLFKIPEKYDGPIPGLSSILMLAMYRLSVMVMTVSTKAKE